MIGTQTVSGGAIPLRIIAAAGILVLMAQAQSGLHWVEWATFWILVVSVAWPILRSAYLEYWAKPRTFSLKMLTPGGQQVDVRRFPPGESQCEFYIHCRYPVTIHRFGLRFVAHKDGDNIEAGIISVSGFTHAEVVDRFPLNARAVLDGKNGVEVLYEPPMLRSPVEPMRIKLDVVAGSNPWSGFLRLRTHDNDGYSRYAVVRCSVDPRLTPSVSHMVISQPSQDA